MIAVERIEDFEPRKNAKTENESRHSLSSPGATSRSGAVFGFWLVAFLRRRWSLCRAAFLTLDNRIGMDENVTQTWTLYDVSDPISRFGKCANYFEWRAR